MSSLSEEVIVRSLMVVVEARLPLCDKKVDGFAVQREFVQQCCSEITRRLEKIDYSSDIHMQNYRFIGKVFAAIGWG